MLENPSLTRKGYFTGKLSKPDCLRDEKIKRLKEEISLDSVDFTNSEFYTDCWSDAPLMSLFGKNFFVYKRHYKNNSTLNVTPIKREALVEN